MKLKLDENGHVVVENDDENDDIKMLLTKNGIIRQNKYMFFTKNV
ncbi:hypothetical protein P2K05_13980 [Mannheimia haemolytica]|nr:hypothetical protein [Mannheimia haemolytica]